MLVTVPLGLFFIVVKDDVSIRTATDRMSLLLTGRRCILDEIWLPLAIVLLDVVSGCASTETATDAEQRPVSSSPATNLPPAKLMPNGSQQLATTDTAERVSSVSGVSTSIACLIRQRRSHKTCVRGSVSMTDGKSCLSHRRKMAKRRLMACSSFVSQSVTSRGHVLIYW